MDTPARSLKPSRRTDWAKGRVSLERRRLRPTEHSPFSSCSGMHRRLREREPSRGPSARKARTPGGVKQVAWDSGRHAPSWRCGLKQLSVSRARDTLWVISSFLQPHGGSSTQKQPQDHPALNPDATCMLRTGPAGSTWGQEGPAAPSEFGGWKWPLAPPQRDRFPGTEEGTVCVGTFGLWGSGLILDPHEEASPEGTEVPGSGGPLSYWGGDED